MATKQEWQREADDYQRRMDEHLASGGETSDMIYESLWKRRNTCEGFAATAHDETWDEHEVAPAL